MPKIARTASVLLLPGYTPCQHCDNVLPPGKSRCTECWGWAEGRKVRHIGVPGDEDTAYFRLSDVQQEVVERLDLGPAMNPLLGSDDNGYGLPWSTTLLFAGMAGVGKTTMMVQALDPMVEALDVRYPDEDEPRCVLYVAAEQSGSELRMVADRIRVQHMDRVIVAPVRGGAFDIDSMLEDVNPGVVIVDSLSGLLGATGGDSDAILFCDRLKDYALEREVPSIIISHVNKEREPAGVYTLQHNVDAVMLAVLGDKDAPPDEPVDEKARTLHVLKNRYGRAPATDRFTMTQRGLVRLGDREPITASPDERGRGRVRGKGQGSRSKKAS